MSAAGLSDWLRRLRAGPAPASRCEACRHFTNDPAALEAAFPNLAAMSSGYGSVRAADGICGLRGLYLPATDGCASFSRAA
jgi:hypothetical protein